MKPASCAPAILAAILFACIAVFLGAVVVDFAGERVGPITDLVISSMLVFILAFAVSRRMQTDQSFMGAATGFLCSASQVLMSLLAGHFQLVGTVLYTVLYTIIGLIGGVIAARD